MTATKYARWVATDLTVADLRRYRRLFGGVSLLMLLNFHWPAAYPDSVFTPPPGPFQLFDGFLPLGVTLVLEVTLALCYACLLFDVQVRWASIGASVLFVFLAGFAYSLGKVNHTILTETLPVVMLAAGWGLATTEQVRGWALRLMAFVLGLAMLSAALMKLMSGWLELDTHAVMGFAVESHYQQGNRAPLSGLVADLTYGPLWEVLDLATVLMEGLVIALVFASWRAFRIGLAVLALFHLGVALTLNIEFSFSILVYAAFLPWSRVRLPTLPVLPEWGRALLAVTTALVAWGVSAQVGNAAWLVSPLLLWIGAAVAVWYLGGLTAQTIRGRSKAMEVAHRPDT